MTNYNNMNREEFNEQEYHEFMDALQDKESNVFEAWEKLNEDFRKLCVEISNSVIKNEQINLKWLADYISTAEFLASFLPRLFKDESMKEYITIMTEKIKEQDEFADDGDIANYLFGKIHEVEYYMPDYMQMIEDAYEALLDKMYVDEFDED